MLWPFLMDIYIYILRMTNQSNISLQIIKESEVCSYVTGNEETGNKETRFLKKLGNGT